jgi:hypothetical protein
VAPKLLLIMMTEIAAQLSDLNKILSKAVSPNGGILAWPVKESE